MLYQGLIIFQVLVAAGIIALVLLQQGRGADAGAAFGSGASGTVFGARGAASFLTRATAVLAVLFFSSSLFLAVVGVSSKPKEDLFDLPGLGEPAGELPSAPTADGKGSPLSDLPAELPGNGSTKEIVEPSLQGDETMPDIPIVQPDVPMPPDLEPPDDKGGQ